MKKIMNSHSTYFLALLFILSVFSCSCGNTNRRIPRFAANKNGIPQTYPGSSIKLATAQVLINNYDTLIINNYDTLIKHCDSFKSIMPSYYIFDKGQLTNYITDFGVSNVKFIHFLLAFDTISKKASLILCAVNDSLGHGYDTITSDTNSYVFSSESNLNIKPDAFDNVPGKFDVLPLSQVIDTLLFSNAKNMINNYSVKVNNTALSFLANGTDLNNYIGMLTSARYLQVYLANDFNRLTLIFVGLEANGRHVYLSDPSGNCYVLENCMPCPICDVAQNGYNLENSPK